MAPRTKTEEVATTSKPARTRKAAPKQEKIKYTDFDVQVAFPNDGDDDGFRYETVGRGESFAIARDVAFALAKQGLRVRYPQPANERNDTDGWYVTHKAKADELSDASWEKYAAESIADRAILVASEMKIRSRVGNLIGELRHIMDESRSPHARQSLRHGLMEVSRAAFAPLTGSHISSIGFTLLPDYMDILANAAAAQGVELGQACPGCGGFHNDEQDGLTIEQLLQMADDQWEADPVAEALVQVEGVQA